MPTVQQHAEHPSLTELIFDVNIATIDGERLLVTNTGELYGYADLLELAQRAKQLIHIVNDIKGTYDVGEYDRFADHVHDERMRFQEKARVAAAERHHQVRQQVQIYLMHNSATDEYKIGYSKRPAYREATLQSQEPTISMLAYYPGIKADELVLHKRFAAKRTRGEWFALTADDIEAFHAYFNRGSDTATSAI